jgi:hypothetical protein
MCIDRRRGYRAQRLVQKHGEKCVEKAARGFQVDGFFVKPPRANEEAGLGEFSESQEILRPMISRNWDERN